MFSIAGLAVSKLLPDNPKEGMFSIGIFGIPKPLAIAIVMRLWHQLLRFSLSLLLLLSGFMNGGMHLPCLFLYISHFSL
jgi:hypothetical protein